MDLTLNTDGAARGNPGPASYGFVLKNSGVILHQEGKVIGEETNNVAEYSAIIAGLLYVKENCLKKGPCKLGVFADSQLVVRQLSGLYRVKNPTLAILFARIKKLESEVGEVMYTHIPREENFLADRLANMALDKDIF